MIKYFASKNMLEDKKISGERLTIMMLLNSLARDNSNIYFNNNQLYYLLCGELNKDTKDIILKRINNEIKQLIKQKKIDLIDSRVKEYIISSKNILNSSDNFVVIYENELHKIFNVSSKVNCFELFRYFLNIVSTINQDTKCWGTNIDTLAKKSFIHINTALAYNKILEDNKLIYIHRYKNFVYNSNYNTIQNINNTYGRYTDKKFIIQGGVENVNRILGGCGYEEKIKNSSFQGRSISAKYNHFVTGLATGKEYSKEYIEELYALCLEYNQYYEGIEGKEKDLSIFQKVSDVSVQQ